MEKISFLRLSLALMEYLGYHDHSLMVLLRKVNLRVVIIRINPDHQFQHYEKSATFYTESISKSKQQV